MSSAGSDLRLELPPRLLADRISAVLIPGCAVVLEAVLWRYPGLPQGAGLGCGLLLAAWRHARRHRAVRVAELGAHGWRLQFADGQWAEARPGPGARRLGATVVLPWQTSRGPVRLWLTAVDLPRPLLRALILRLAAGGARGDLADRSRIVAGP
jgi:hypothetical protein